MVQPPNPKEQAVRVTEIEMTTPAIAQRVEQLAAWHKECERVVKAAWSKVSAKDKRTVYGTSSCRDLSLEEVQGILKKANMTMPPMPPMAGQAQIDLAARGGNTTVDERNSERERSIARVPTRNRRLAD